jgi:hypothetical protein
MFTNVNDTSAAEFDISMSYTIPTTTVSSSNFKFVFNGTGILNMQHYLFDFNIDNTILSNQLPKVSTIPITDGVFVEYTYGKRLTDVSAIPLESSANLYTQVNRSYFDLSNNYFVDTSTNTPFSIPNIYYYDVSSFLIQIQSIGYDNFNCPSVTIPIVLTAYHDKTNGETYSCSQFVDALNLSLNNNQTRLYRDYRIQLQTNPFSSRNNNLIFNPQISTVLTQTDYKLSLFDPIGFPINTDIGWSNINNAWYNYLGFQQSSYDLSSTSIAVIDGSGKFIDIAPNQTVKITDQNALYTIQDFLGFSKKQTNNMAAWESYTFLGSEYNSDVKFPTIKRISLPSVAFIVHRYQTILHPTTSIPYTYSELKGSNENFYDISYIITFGNHTNDYISIRNIINQINSSIQSYGVFTSDSGIYIHDSLTNDILQDSSLLDTNYYYYRCKLLFDRKQPNNNFKSRNVNMKTCLTDINTTTFMGNMHFICPGYHETTPNYDISYIELSNVTSQDVVKANTYDVISNPFVYLRCITPGYAGFPDNDTSFSIPIPNGWYKQVGYTLNQYLDAINLQINGKSNWGLNGSAYVNSNNKFQMDLNIQRFITSVNDNSTNYHFQVDFSKSVLRKLNTDISWVMYSYESQHTFTNLVYPSSYIVDETNDKITITVQGNNQGGQENSSFPFHNGGSAFPYISNNNSNNDGTGIHRDNIFRTYLYIPHGYYDSTKSLINVLNTMVFPSISQSFYGNNAINANKLHGQESNSNYIPFVGNSIPNGRVSMYGSTMDFVIGSDFTMNTITLKLSIRSILTNQDYRLEFYDPNINNINTRNIPGLTNCYVKQASSFGAQYCDFNPIEASWNYTATISNGKWTDTSNNWHKLFIPDASFFLVDNSKRPSNLIIYTNSSSERVNSLNYYPEINYTDISYTNIILNLDATIGAPASTTANVLLKTLQNTLSTKSSIIGNTTLIDKKLHIDASNNFFTIIPNVDKLGGVYINNPSTFNNISENANDIKIVLDLPLNNSYNSDEVINSINRAFTAYTDPNTYIDSETGQVSGRGNILKGSQVSIDKTTNFSNFQIHIQNIFTEEDYALTIFDEQLFTHCNYGSQSSLETTTRDTTLGWLLGFRYLTSYDLRPSVIKSFNQTNKNKSIIYQYDYTSKIVTITGDTAVSITLYNYLLIVLDDYTQNHLNDGLVTIINPTTDIPLPSYANRNTFRCASVNNTLSVYIGSDGDQVTNNGLTAKQLYSANQILQNQQNQVYSLSNQTQSYHNSQGIYMQDIFGIIPMKTSGMINGQVYVEFGGTLQNQERAYFGPVNLKRMSVKVLTDKGTILNLNNANWSFSLLVQQLYNPIK